MEICEPSDDPSPYLVPFFRERAGMDATPSLRPPQAMLISHVSLQRARALHGLSKQSLLACSLY